MGFVHILNRKKNITVKKYRKPSNMLQFKKTGFFVANLCPTVCVAICRDEEAMSVVRVTIRRTLTI